MRFDFTDEQKALRREARAYFAGLLTPADLDDLAQSDAGPTYKRLIRQMGQDGWLAVGWPTEYGGRGFSALEQLVFLEEALRAGAPIPFVTLNTVGPTLITKGSDEHRARFLPDIAAGKIHFSIGYTEPEAGTDLAALKTAAIRDGDDFIVNGSKIFTSQAEAADYIWLAVRTDPEAPLHRGISILIVDTRTPGFSLEPLYTLGNRTNITRYDNVRVPGAMLVGELNKGWRLITSQLNHERVALAARSAAAEALFERALAYAQAPGPNDRPLTDREYVRHALAQAYSLLQALRLFNSRLAYTTSVGEPEPAFSSAVKVFGADSLIEAARAMIEVTGLPGLLKRGSPGAALAGDLERFYRATQIITFGGGVSEVMGEIIAQFGLGLPKTDRRVS